MKTKFVKDLKEGQVIEELFLLKEKVLRDYAGGQFLTLGLQDKTGTISAVCWEEAARIFEKIPEGTLVQIKGKVSSYKKNLQITIEKISPLEGLDLKIKIADFVPTTDKDIEKMFEDVKKFISSVKNPFFSKLLSAFFNDTNFVETYKTAPAATFWHQAYLGGLLEHSLNVARICDFVLTLYPELNRDLLLTGALLHDIGKIRELQYPIILDYTDAGRLLGHITIQDAWLAEKIKNIPDFPEDLGLQIRHLLLSHHGEREAGSPKRPKTAEAAVLHQADILDAHAAGFTELIKKARLSGKTWSDYIRLIDRYLYAGKDTENNN